MNRRFWVLLFGFAQFFAAGLAYSEPIRVMSFNVMCDFCGKERETGRFSQRLKGIADTINRYDPDLISLQELRNRNQVRRLQKRLNRKYHSIFSRGRILSYADATLLIRKDRFQVIRSGGAWLGPHSPHFSFGWKPGFPRRIEWADVESRATGERLRFIGSHFDNAVANKEPSARLLKKGFGGSEMPTIFAGDSNLRTDMPGYRTLLGAFRDTYDEVKDHPYYSSRATVNSDGCTLNPAETFPECRIDHILLSHGSPWRVQSWGLDVEKYYGSLGFVSDHRAVIVDLE